MARIRSFPNPWWTSWLVHWLRSQRVHDLERGSLDWGDGGDVSLIIFPDVESPDHSQVPASLGFRSVDWKIHRPCSCFCPRLVLLVQVTLLATVAIESRTHFFSFCITIANELAAANTILSFWTDEVPIAAWIVIWWVVITAINVGAVTVFGEIEVISSTIKFGYVRRQPFGPVQLTYLELDFRGDLLPHCCLCWWSPE
jgi:hypothetical protein